MQISFDRRKRFFLLAVVAALLSCFTVSRGHGHDVITSTITYNREVRAILQAHCTSCHRAGGSAFSLTSYAEVRPWAKAIEEEVLQRRMPPWGAVRGFGEFRNDPTLSMSQLQQVAEWAEGGAPEGDPVAMEAIESAVSSPNTGSRLTSLDSGLRAPAQTPSFSVVGETKLKRALAVAGFEITQADSGASVRVILELPNGEVIPLVWLDHFDSVHRWQFLLREPLRLPQGTLIKGLPRAARMTFLLAVP
jgi:mono/diheme cytochrome c family protein